MINCTLCKFRDLLHTNHHTTMICNCICALPQYRAIKERRLLWKCTHATTYTVVLISLLVPKYNYVIKTCVYVYDDISTTGRPCHTICPLKVSQMQFVWLGLQTSSGVVTFAMTSSRSILLIIIFLVSLHQFLTYIIYFLLIFYYCNQVTTVSDTLFISC